MPKTYILELCPHEYGVFKSKKRWKKYFPELKQTGTNKFQLKAEERDLSYYKRLCKKVRVDCLIYEERFARSRTYRSEFLKIHPPLPNGKYRCWYCGKKTKKITVDHIISIAAAKRDVKVQKYLDRKKIDINGEDNLALCCYKCNQLKGHKQSRFYIRQAKRGRHESYWKVRSFLRTILILGIAAFTGFLIYDVYTGSHLILHFFRISFAIQPG